MEPNGLARVHLVPCIIYAVRVGYSMDPHLLKGTHGPRDSTGVPLKKKKKK